MTITTNSDFISGSIATMEEAFVMVIDLIMYASFLAVGLIILNVLIKRFTNHKRIELFVLLLALFLMIGCIAGFCFATSILSDATVGSIFGSGEVNVAIYGENVFQKIPCSWGLNIGFYSFVFSTIVLISMFLSNIRNRFFKSKNYK